MIAPTFESLATKYSKPKKITFCKVNVDNQREVAQQYGVRAMPTFLVFHNGSVVNTIQGANPPALTAAVEKAVKLAGPGGGSSFSSPGQRLGGSGLGSSSRGSRSLSLPRRWNLNKFIDAVITFFGLYFISLFSVSGASLSRSSRHCAPFTRPVTEKSLAVRPLQSCRELAVQQEESSAAAVTATSGRQCKLTARGTVDVQDVGRPRELGRQ